MEDAKRRKKEWKMKLSDMELTNCLELRDSLMAMASIHLMGVDDCKSIVSVINTQVINYLLSCYTLLLHCNPSIFFSLRSAKIKKSGRLLLSQDTKKVFVRQKLGSSNFKTDLRSTEIQ